MLEEHDVPETGFVPYRYAVLPYLFLNETWVEAFEIKPDNPSVVHHCNMAYVTKDGAGEDTFITGYVPGGQPMDLAHFDNGVAVRIPAGAGLGLQIHYTTTGKEERCKIRVGLRFPRRTVRGRFAIFCLIPGLADFLRQILRFVSKRITLWIATRICWGYSLTCTFVVVTCRSMRIMTTNRLRLFCRFQTTTSNGNWDMN